MESLLTAKTELDLQKPDLRKPRLYCTAPGYLCSLAAPNHAIVGRFNPSIVSVGTPKKLWDFPLKSLWNSPQNLASLALVLTLEIGFISAQGLYQSGEKRYDYFKLSQSVFFAHLLMVMIQLIYQPEQFTLTFNLSNFCDFEHTADLWWSILYRLTAQSSCVNMVQSVIQLS